MANWREVVVDEGLAGINGEGAESGAGRFMGGMNARSLPAPGFL
jgi:hypothetical protein